MKKLEKEITWSVLGPIFLLALLVSWITFVRTQNYLEYSDYNQALSYILNNLSGTERYPPSLDSSSYLYGSPIIFDGKSQIQIINFKNYVSKENMIFTRINENKWEPKPTSKEEEILKIFFEEMQK